MSPLLVFIGRGSPDTQTILVVSGKCVLTVPAIGAVETPFQDVFGGNCRFEDVPARIEKRSEIAVCFVAEPLPARVALLVDRLQATVFDLCVDLRRADAGVA